MLLIFINNLTFLKDSADLLPFQNALRGIDLNTVKI